MIRFGALLFSFLIGVASANAQDLFADQASVLSARSGISVSEITKLREAATAARELGRPLMVSLIFADYEREARDQATTPRQAIANGDSWSVQIAPGVEGISPIRLGPNTIVWHRFGHQASSILGEYNPALTNSKIAQMLENKWVEFLFWEKYAPGSMPKTQILTNLFRKRPTALDAQNAFNSQFPKGWVLKGAFDWATGPMVLTNSTNLDQAIKNLEAGNFQEHQEKLKAVQHTMDPDDFIEALQKHPDYKGHRAQTLLQYFKRTIVQEKLDIEKEYRVEVVNGRVVVGDSTVDRYAYLSENPKTFWDAPIKNPKRPTAQDQAIMRAAEKFAQSMLDRVPEQLRAFSAAMDIARTKDGRFFLIEANAGGNSGYLSFRAASRRAVEKQLLQDFKANRNKAEAGLQTASQAKFIQTFLQLNNVDMGTQYPFFDWTSTGLRAKWLEKPAKVSYAGQSLTFGNEITLTSEEMIQDFGTRGENDPSTAMQFDAVEKFFVEIQKACPDCKVEKTVDRYGELAVRVENPARNWGFTVTTDPFVIEIITDPQTSAQATQNEKLMQTLIFDIGKKIGLQAHKQFGGGHIHIGRQQAFQENPLIFRNLMVQVFNDSNIWKLFGAMKRNAAVITELKDREKVMEKIIAEFDLKLMKDRSWQNNPQKASALIDSLAQQLIEKVFDFHPKNASPAAKFQAINILRLVDPRIPYEQRTIEFRFFRGQKHTKQLLNTLTLLDRYFKHVQSQKTLIPLNMKEAATDLELQKKNFRIFSEIVDMSKEDLKDLFYEQESFEAIGGGKMCRSVLLQ